jgi:hypothetical protein
VLSVRKKNFNMTYGTRRELLPTVPLIYWEQVSRTVFVRCGGRFEFVPVGGSFLVPSRAVFSVQVRAISDQGFPDWRSYVEDLVGAD